MKEDTFYVFTQLQSPLRGAHYLLRESFTNIEKFAEKKDTDGIGCECTLCILLDIHGDWANWHPECKIF